MLDLQKKIKRQIEIVGLVSNTCRRIYHTPDLAELFDCEELTIKRDLQELRAAGIDIHSEKRHGVCIAQAVDHGILTEMVLQYVGICYAKKAVDKTTSLLVRKKKIQALHDIVHLQRAIEKNLLVEIDYEKEKDGIDRGRLIGPIMIFQSEGLFRLLALHDGIVKQYHLNKIASLRTTMKKFKPVPPAEVEELFRYSWRSWLGSERHTVVLKFSKEWNEWRNPRRLMDADSVTEHEDGSADITFTVNSLNEIASWIAGRGKGIVVVEPAELRTKVIELAQGTISNYD